MKKIILAILSLSSFMLAAEPAPLVAACNHVLVGSQRIPDELRNNARKIHYLNPMWFDILSDGKVVPRQGCEGPYELYSAFCRSNGIKLLPIFRNFSPTAFLSNREARSLALTAITAMVEKEGFDGILLDLESLVTRDKTGYHEFLKDLAVSFRAKKKILMNAVPAHVFNGEMDLAEAARDSDFLFVMFYDYTSTGTKRLGPTAPVRFKSYPRDVVRDLEIMLNLGVPPEKILLGVPFYGVDFTLNADKKVTAMDTLYWSQLERLRVSKNARSEWDEESKCWSYSYTDPQGVEHQVWFEDAKAFGEKIKMVREKKLAGFGFWAITPRENADPGVWKLLGETSR